MAPLQTVANDNSDLRPRHHHQRQKRSTKIPSQTRSNVPLAAASPSNTNSALGTLIVSLPSGRLLSVHEEECGYSFKLGDSLSAGENLLQKLDGKGAKLLTLQAFGGTTKARMFARLKFDQISRPCSFVCEFVADPTSASNKIATIRVFGIQFAMKPEKNCDEFITRHNSGCNLIYFDAGSVPYLGHFPSEKTGSSLFSIVYSQDADRLVQEVHKELRAGVKLARTNGIRLVAHDGRVWRVNSEWAAFTNPWTDHVEMVVAKHRVIEMVGQLQSGESLLSDQQCRQYDNAIRAILESPPEYKEEKLVTNISGAASPPLTTKNSEDSPQSPDLLLSYNQINCLENVHRLLKSQTNDNSQADNSQTVKSDSSQAAPLTQELLNQHDRNWKANFELKWHKRLQMKRAISSSNASSSAEIAPKMARTEPTSPSAITTNSATNLFLSLLLEQQRRLQQQPIQNGHLSMLAISNLIAQNASGTSTPSNL